MVKYILKWNKNFKKANGNIIPWFAMENPLMITGKPEKAVQFETKEEAQKFVKDNSLNNFSIIIREFSLDQMLKYLAENKQ